MNWIKKIFGGETKKSLTRSLEQAYNDLKSKNPDKDEHWLLANTWLARYGNWEASKEKGPKVTRFIAYKDTFQFSLLDSPKSIRALVLYLIYKELGGKDAESGAEEFGRLWEESQEMQIDGKLMEKYRKKNPFTWNASQNEGDNSMYSLHGFFESADHLNKNPEESERIGRELHQRGLDKSPEEI